MSDIKIYFQISILREHSQLHVALRNGHIVEVGDLLPSDFRLRVLTPVTVDAVEISVLVFLGEDSVKL